MDEFDSAVIASFNPTAPELRKKANEYCESVKAAPDGWKFCLEKFFGSNVLQVKFFCLVVIQETIQYKYNALSAADQNLLRQTLLRFIREVIPQSEPEGEIKNKFAQIVALLFKVEYPQSWPTFFSDITSSLSLSTSSVDMFLRVMNNIDDEIINQEMLRNTEEVARSAEIKDYIRDHAIVELASTWYSILETFKSTNPSICSSCLENIRRYTNWIDINLITRSFVPHFFAFLTREELREKASECIHELVNKGMPDPVAKLKLIDELNLTVVFNNINPQDDPDFLEGVAKIVNTTGLELLSAIKGMNVLAQQQKISGEIIVKAQQILEEMVVLTFKFMDNEDDNVSQSAYRFANGYLQSLKNTSISPKQLEFLQTFLPIIRKKMTYDSSYNFDKHDEEEQFFNDLRKDLLLLFKLITNLSPQLVSSFVLTTLQGVISNIQSIDFATVEVAVYLVYSLGETILKDLEPFLREMIVLLASSNISLYPHRSVTLIYFDTITRYIRFLPDNPEALKSILISFFDGRGIRNPFATIKSRVCYLFQRLVKAHTQSLQPFLPSIISALEPFLVFNSELSKTIAVDDQINIFDAIGTLVGTIPRQEQDKYLEALLVPMIKQMETIINGKLWNTETTDKPIFTGAMVQIISLIGTFSKGFNGQKDSGKYFEKLFEMIIPLPSLLPSHEEVRIKVLFYTHRMIECLVGNVLQYVPPLINQSLQNCSLKAFFEFVRLINQLISRFKEQMFPVMDPLLSQIIERFYKYVNEVANGSTQEDKTALNGLSEVEREIVEIQRQYYAFVSTLIGNGLSHVLRTPQNAPYIQRILKTVLEGCKETRDMSACKQCYSIVKKFAENWAGNDPQTSLPGFNQFVYEEITPVLIGEPLRPNFDLSDAGVALVITEIASAQKIIFQKCGKEFLTFLTTVYFPSIQCPPDMAQEYAYRLEQLGQKEFRAAFISFLNSVKSSQKANKPR
eukprot:TRINITY_DN13746_c0_g1_i1.p1 TRINITY_DN13746_c0_g1~~TRINITY_DN13746_c0_g1_i1.p1  ORF type:complete len:965 (-),score=282.39 TRINITY_DN13746_c0_g1_i1:38-2932(-)